LAGKNGSGLSIAAQRREGERNFEEVSRGRSNRSAYSPRKGRSKEQVANLYRKDLAQKENSFFFQKEYLSGKHAMRREGGRGYEESGDPVERRFLL